MGVLPIQDLQGLVADERITADTPIEGNQLQPNSLDLRVGNWAYRTRCSFLPAGKKMPDLLSRYSIEKIPLKNNALLECNKTYVLPIKEGLCLPRHLRGRANPKSTTGRLDILARVVTDDGELFDTIPPGYKGRLWLDVIPRSFPIRIRSGDRLAQMRIIHGGNSCVEDADLSKLIDTRKIVCDSKGLPIPSSKMTVDNGIFLTVSLRRKDGGPVYYESQRSTEAVDLRARGLPAGSYWRRYTSEDLATDSVILQPDVFYLFSSQQRISIPAEICGEVVAYDPKGGELRTHYAGFLDSGFGGRNGAHLVLEVRNKNMPFLVQDSQRLFRVRFFWNESAPERLYGRGSHSHYQGQRLRLAKQFHEGETRSGLSDPDGLF